MLLIQSVAGCGTADERQVVDDNPPSTAVVDRADVLPAAEREVLEQRLRSYLDETGTALVVATVPNLEGKTIEKYAFDLFNEWGIGDPKTNRGLLVLVAPNDRRMRIEVGCGLEAVITNDEAAKIIRDEMRPLYLEGDIAGGTIAGVDALIDELAKPPLTGPPVSRICRENLKEAA